MTIEDFIAEHSRTAGAETANEHRFILGLCELLNLPKLEGTVAYETKSLFVFQKAVKFNNGDGTTSDGRIDLYKAACFVWESKQGADAKAPSKPKHSPPPRSKSDSTAARPSEAPPNGGRPIS